MLDSRTPLKEPFGCEIAQERSLGIALRQCGCGDRPFDADIGIVPAEAQLILRRVGLGAFVVKQCGFADDREAMRKSRAGCRTAACFRL